MEQDMTTTQSREPTAKQIYAVFRSNCVSFPGNYEVTPGQAQQIAKHFLQAGRQAVLAELRTQLEAAQKDTARLDWLDTFGNGWTCRLSTTGRGYRLHQTTNPDHSIYMTARLAIDAAHNAESNGAKHPTRTPG